MNHMNEIAEQIEMSIGRSLDSVELVLAAQQTPRFDEDGRMILELATCGGCGRVWNDAAISSTTPTPSGRCPFEYEHDRDAEHRQDGRDEMTRERAERDAAYDAATGEGRH